MAVGHLSGRTEKTKKKETRLLGKAKADKFFDLEAKISLAPSTKVNVSELPAHFAGGPFDIVIKLYSNVRS